jgi:hypothetical protein
MGHETIDDRAVLRMKRLGGGNTEKRVESGVAKAEFLPLKNHDKIFGIACDGVYKGETALLHFWLRSFCLLKANHMPRKSVWQKEVWHVTITP